MTLKIKIATVTMTVVLQIETEFLAFFVCYYLDYFFAAKKCWFKPNTAYLFNTLRNLVIIRSGMLNLDMACKILDQYDKWHMVLKNFFPA